MTKHSENSVAPKGQTVYHHSEVYSKPSPNQTQVTSKTTVGRNYVGHTSKGRGQTVHTASATTRKSSTHTVTNKAGGPLSKDTTTTTFKASASETKK